MKISFERSCALYGKELIHFDAVLVYHDIDTYLKFVAIYLKIDTFSATRK